MVILQNIISIKNKISSKYHYQTYNEFENKMNELGIPCINLTQKLTKYAENNDRLYFSIDGHFNETGHKYTAMIISGLFEGKIIY